jgi:hypothetical protein
MTPELRHVWRHFQLAVARFVVVWILCPLILLALLVRCASAESIFAHGFEETGAGGGEVDACLDPLVMPAGYAHRSKTWVAAFTTPGSPTPAAYPNSSGYPVPVPGYEWFTRYQVGFYRLYLKSDFVAIGFVAQANTDISMTWDTAQSAPNYGMPRPANAMFVGVSPCPWDARPSLLCSKVSGQDSLFLTTRFGSACPLIAGETYYINVVMADPQDGFAHTCSETAPNSANGCDVQMVHSGTVGVLRQQQPGVTP